MTQIKVARFQGPSEDHPLKIGQAEKPTPGPKDVLVKVHACSVVPNTANMLTKTGSLPDGFTVAKDPIVFGLDVSGIIEEVGQHVLNLKVGDRVYVNPWLYCDTCQACRRGRNDLCSAGALRGYFALGDQGKKTLERYPLGGLSEYVLSPDSNITVIPESIELDIAARFGYIGTSYGALRKGEVGPGSTVLINGVTGTLGYAAVAIALGFGATKILGIGRNPERLKDVASLGSSKRIVVASSEEEKDLAEWVKKNTNSLGPDVLIDCLGVGGDADTTMNLIRSIKRGGKAILVAGGAEGEVTQSYTEAMMHEVAIIGSNWFTTGEIDDLVAMIDAGVIDFSFLQHKAFSLDEANEAIKCVGDRPGGAVNVLVKPGN